MVAMDLKAEIKSLEQQRNLIELEMNSIISRLCGPGGPGISGNLVDAEGFPRADLDIPSVRADRHRLCDLRNDYKDMTSKISDKLEILHSARLQNVSVVTSYPVHESGSNAPISDPEGAISTASHEFISEDTVMAEGAVLRVPFAAIDEITDGSPAALSGLQLGDQVVKFGSVEAGDELLRRLAHEAISNQGHPVPLVILRQGTVVNLTVTPRQWEGRGLLGCNFRIL